MKGTHMGYLPVLQVGGLACLLQRVIVEGERGERKVGMCEYIYIYIYIFFVYFVYDLIIYFANIFFQYLASLFIFLIVYSKKSFFFF